MSRINGPSLRRHSVLRHIPLPATVQSLNGNVTRKNRFFRETGTAQDLSCRKSSRNALNEQSLEPIVLQLGKLSILPSGDFDYYFTDLTNRKRIQAGIDSIWQFGSLFSGQDKPNSSFYSTYIEFLLFILKENASYFSKFTFNGVSRNWNLDTNFEIEFNKLANKTGLNELQKSISLTQALELALIGINPTPVLANINSQSDGVHSRGFRNELLAAWYLAKFVYNLTPNGEADFTLSEMLPTCRRDIDKGKTFNSLYEREIDIIAHDALVSVRSTGTNNYSTQIADLFFVVIDDRNLDLREKIRKLILIRNIEKKSQLSPEYRQNAEYMQIRDSAISKAREKIKKFQMSPEAQQLFNKLVSKDGIEIYFIPSLNDLNGLKMWIDENYRLPQEV